MMYSLTILRNLLLAIVTLAYSLNANAQWMSSNNGLYGGPINDLTVNGTNLFAATPGGVYLSSNNGANWAPVNSGLFSTYINCLVTSNGIIYAGTNVGVSISSNNGTSWTAGIASFGGVYSIAVANGTVFAGTQQGVYLSSDNGIVWTEKNNGLTSPSIHALSISGSNIFAGTSSGVFVSSNNGDSWSLTSQSDFIISLASNGINIYAGMLNGLYLSIDDGANWTPINSGLTPGFLVNTLAFDNGSVYAGTGSGVFVSTNNGTSWTSTTSFTSYNVDALAIGNGYIFAGTASDFFRSSDNGASWNTSNTGLTNTYVRAMATSDNATFVGTFGNGVYSSSNSGLNWADSNTGLTEKYVASILHVGSSLFAGTYSGLFVSSNDGATWAATGFNWYITALATSGINILAGTFGGGVHLSANNGITWTEVNTGLTNTMIYSFEINGGSIFVGTGNGVFLTTNNGASWASVSTGLPLNSRVNSLAFSNGNLFAATDGGLFISSNNGTSWTQATIPDTYMNVVMVFGSNIFAATGYGNLYLSKDNGNNWTNIGSAGTGWGNYASILSMKVSGSNLLVGTNKGVWSRSLADIREPQTISFGAIASKTFGDLPFNLSATSSSGLAITYTSSDPTVASIYENTVTILNVGTSVITASQAGDETYKPAVNVQQSLIVNKASQQITFNALSSKTIGDAAFDLAASSNSGLPIAFSTTSSNITLANNQVTLLTAGSATITASQSGNENYNAASAVNQTFCINPVKPIVTVTNLNTSTPTLTSSATSGNQWFLNGLVITGATNQTYSATESGLYKVRVTTEGCSSDFSNEEALIVTGGIFDTNNSIELYPNPVTDWLSISLGEIEGKKEIALSTITGQLISSHEVLGNAAIFNLQDYSKGVYLVKISARKSLKVIKFVKL